MKKTGFGEIIISIITVLVCIGMLGVIIWQASFTNPQKEPTDELWTLEIGEPMDEFTDLVQGYSMMVPHGLEVDMNYSSVRAVLKNEDMRIEIYKQPMENTSFESYTSYSNYFLEAEEVQVVCNEEADWQGQRAKILIWNREKLPNCESDLCHYVNIEIPPVEATGSAFTVFIKSGHPIESKEDAVYMLNSFKLLKDEELKDPYVRVSAERDIKSRGWNKETEAFYQKYFGEKAKLTWGIFEPKTARFDYSQLEKYETYFDYNFPVLVNYTEADVKKHKNLKGRLERAWEHKGAVLELTLQMVPNDDKNMLYGVLNGEYDDFLYDYAKVIADFGHPVVFRPMNEMNGDWCVYSAYHTSKDTEVYKNAYKYIYNVFKETGATANTIWVWNPNSLSYPDFRWNHTLMYYPEDEYVDVIGLTAYNTGAYYHTVGEDWIEFSDLYQNMYNTYLDWFGQPFMITEFASASFGGDKAKWMESMFEQLQGYDKVKLAIWWDGCDWDVYGNVARSYFLDEDEACLDVFKRGIKGEIPAKVNVSDTGKVRGLLKYNTAYTKNRLQELILALAKDKREAFLKGTTIEELKKTGSDNTRPDWLILRKDGTYGYSKEKLKELIDSGYIAGEVKAGEVKNPAHSPEATVGEDIKTSQKPVKPDTNSESSNEETSETSGKGSDGSDFEGSDGHSGKGLEKDSQADVEAGSGTATATTGGSLQIP